MYFKKVPEWLFIIYSIDDRDVSKGRFKPTIESSIPFATKEEAERYRLEYINNIESMYDYDIDNSITTQFAVIPIHSNIGKIKITYTGNSSIRIGKSKALKFDSDRPVNWYIDSDIGATFISEGNAITVNCPNGDFAGKTITVNAEDVNGFCDKCVLTVVSDV